MAKDANNIAINLKYSLKFLTRDFTILNFKRYVWMTMSDLCLFVLGYCVLSSFILWIFSGIWEYLFLRYSNWQRLLEI